MHRLPRSLTLRQHLRPLPRRTQPLRIQRRAKSQIVYTNDGEALRYQAVRLLKPGLTLRRVATFGLYVGTVYAFVSFFVQRLEFDIEIVEGEGEELAEGEEQDGEGEEEEDGPPFYADEDSLFIPMTWSRQLPRTYYKGTDPEWQSFIEIAKDPARHKVIHGELLGIVRDGCAAHPGIARQLGKDVKIGKYWLDVSFPEGPPIEYERSGIEIGDGFVAWSQQRVSQENQWRLMRALWPSAAADGTWKTVQVLAGMQFRRVKQALGLEDVDPRSPEGRFAAVLALHKHQQKQQGQTQPQPQPAKTPDQIKADILSGSPGSSHLFDWLFRPKAEEPRPDVPVAMHTFSTALAKGWNAKKLDPPRGALVVSGMVEIRGSRGRMLFDVQSAYHPEKRVFERVSVGVRQWKEWRQRPKGGV